MKSTRTARIIRMRRRRRIQKNGDASRLVRWIGATTTTLVILIFAAAAGIIGLAVGTYLYYARELPPPSRLGVIQQESFETTVLYDRTGQTILYEIIPPLSGDRQYISIHDVPQHFLDATVAIEDSSFYENPGFDVRGIVRAMWANFTGGDVQGGSTITQQLIKNVLIDEAERIQLSVDRKVKEIILASEISRLYNKDQILEWYINTNFYGNLAYGVEAAARVYFNKSARNLTLSESAILAAIPQFPLQNPLDNPEDARIRQEIVLRRMVNLGYITQEEMDAASAEQIIIRPLNDRFEIVAPHFSLYARSEAEKILSQQGYDAAYLFARGGMRIYTTLDVDLQQQFE
ncbi:MAG TPA: transglycosylase domain-containing protein, partial [Aggregatilineales bacterium]|nr:transglycosylase domain-containing protein [Aggregatilineales bacterium]